MGIGIAALVLGAIALLLTWYWSKETSKLIKSEDARAKQLIDEGRRETQQIIEEGRKETKELIRYIASLISAEASKTRELIQTP